MAGRRVPMILHVVDLAVYRRRVEPGDPCAQFFKEVWEDYGRRRRSYDLGVCERFQPQGAHGCGRQGLRAVDGEGRPYSQRYRIVPARRIHKPLTLRASRVSSSTGQGSRSAWLSPARW